MTDITLICNCCCTNTNNDFCVYDIDEKAIESLKELGFFVIDSSSTYDYHICEECLKELFDDYGDTFELDENNETLIKID